MQTVRAQDMSVPELLSYWPFVTECLPFGVLVYQSHLNLGVFAIHLRLTIICLLLKQSADSYQSRTANDLPVIPQSGIGTLVYGQTCLSSQGQPKEETQTYMHTCETYIHIASSHGLNFGWHGIRHQPS